jgi:cytochrome P450
MNIFFLWILSVLFWLLSIYYLWLKTYPRLRYTNLPPGPSHKPFFGEVLNLKPRLYMALDKIAKQYGEITFFYLFFKPIILISSYRAAKEAYNKSELSGRLNSKLILNVSHNSGILFMDGEVWKTHRRLTLKILRDFGVGKSLIEESIQREAEDLCDFIKLKSKNNELMNTSSLISTTAANIILKVVFGVRPGYFNEAPEYTDLLEKLKKITQSTSFVSQFLFPFESLQELIIKSNLIPKNE